MYYLFFQQPAELPCSVFWGQFFKFPKVPAITILYPLPPLPHLGFLVLHLSKYEYVWDDAGRENPKFIISSTLHCFL